MDDYRAQGGKDPGPAERLLKTPLRDLQAKAAEASASRALPEPAPDPAHGEEATRLENTMTPQRAPSNSISGMSLSGGSFFNSRAVSPSQEEAAQETPTPAAEARQEAHKQSEATAEASRSREPHPAIGEPGWLSSMKAKLTPEKLALYEKSRIDAENRAALLDHRRGPSI